MNVQLKVFAGLKQFLKPEMSLELSDSLKVSELLENLVSSYPDAAVVIKHSLVAVNDVMVAKEYSIKDGDTVLILPPIGGG
ncbi:MAG: MoaD/ThiS family protein [Leptospiraceae bacterium]|nr:MoaD/ThiS family protein [Leptospiraceae bacterium]MCP5495580.1 MoaD/ThiS family protein [Leptospiraceae bacterium]